MPWIDGYWVGSLKDGYPPDYFDENDNFRFLWEKDLPKKKPIEKSPENKE